MNWAFKRQLIYLLIFLGIIFLLGFFVIYPYFKKDPTCFDGSQNGSETGVDCGGSCVKACNKDMDDIGILWSRTFRVVPGRYNAVAYLENKNLNTAIYKIKYRFRFADKDNLYIGKREGETFVPPAGKFAVFEPAVDVGNSIPVYTTFEFTEIPNWIQIPKNIVDQLKISTFDFNLQKEDTAPTFSATVKNDSLYRIPDIFFVALLYDASGNVVSASHTYLDFLAPKESKPINFTWQEKFDQKVVSKEVIPIYNIFSVKFK